MKTAAFDVSLWDTRDTAYRALAETLGFPEWFGKNLDALYDLLTEDDYEITLYNTNKAPEKLKLSSFIRVMRDAGALKAEYEGLPEKNDIGPDFICIGRENLSMGSGVVIGPRVTVIAHEKVTIGDHAVIGAGTVITTDPTEKGAPSGCVIIGRNASVGILCAVLPGAVIADGEVIPPRSVVE